VPLAAFFRTEERSKRVRRLFALAAPRRRDLAAVMVALALLPVLVAVAAAQPVVVRQRSLTQRADAQAFFVFDTSLSMSARAGRGAPTRLDRARRDAQHILPTLGDIPVGIATMTDRVLPDLMPTTDLGLVGRTLQQSLGINRPPPSQQYRGKATTLQALFTISSSHLFAPGVTHQILVVFTDGESNPLPQGVAFALAQQMKIPPLFVHTWSPSERIYVHGRLDPRYVPDPASTGVLSQFAELTHGHVFGEHDLGALERTIHAEAGGRPATTQVLDYARIALAPWFVLAGVVPLGFLFWRRNL
jgi:hypothetical protein